MLCCIELLQVNLVNVLYCRIFLLGHCLVLHMVFHWHACWQQLEQLTVICYPLSSAEPMSSATLANASTYWLHG